MEAQQPADRARSRKTAIIKPYVRMDETKHFLVYKNKTLPLSLTEYAILRSMLSPKGLDPVKAGKIRYALRERSTQCLSETLTLDVIKARLDDLRKSIKEHFGDELIIPLMRRGPHTNGLRLWTKEAYDNVYRKMESPEAGCVTIREPNLQWHVYINGYEIMPSGAGGISSIEREIIVRAATPDSFDRNAVSFKKVGRELTGHQEFDVRTLASFFSRFRNALRQIPKPARMTLTTGEHSRVYYLVPGRPQPNKRPSSAAENYAAT